MVTSKVLSTIDSNKFDFKILDYVDISEKISKGVKKSKGPPDLTYLFDKVEHIPEEILNLIGIEKSYLCERISVVIKEFKEFRLEKNTIKTIKKKT